MSEPGVYLKKYPLYTAEQIEDSPSRRDGVPAEMEESRHVNAALAIFETGKVWHMSAGTAAIAVTFYLRFFARKSLKRNQPFIIAAASLMLAGKVNDEPRTYKVLATELFKQWYGVRKKPQLAVGTLDNDAWNARMYRAVLDAEWVLMYYLDYDFNVELVHTAFPRVLKLPALAEVRRTDKLDQFLISTCNDMMKKDGKLVLQYPTSELALGIIEFIITRLHATNAAVPLPALDADGQPWFVAAGLPVDHARDITSRLVKLYSKEPRKGAKGRPAASGAATSGVGGLSMLDAPSETAMRTSPGASTADMASPSFGGGAAGAVATHKAPAPSPAPSSELEEGEIEEGEIV